MNQYDLIPQETREFRTLTFDMLPVGQSFYQRRPNVGSEVGKMIKTPTERTPPGGRWTNAVDAIRPSFQFFVQYDAKIVTEK